MQADLAGKIAIVTGSTSGIGLAIASALAAAGCRIVLNGRRPSEAGEALLTESGAHGLFVAADLGRPEEAQRLIDTVARTWGTAHILVNNAGVQHVAPIDAFPTEAWDRVIALNLNAAFHTTKAALPGMKAGKWGCIVNIASAHGLVASPYKSAYVAAKHGLLGLTKVTALEVATDGITCNAVCPGYVWTPMVAGQIDEQARLRGLSPEDCIRDVILAPQPNGRFVQADEVAAMVVLLASEAGRSITGASIPIDGGWTAR
ncbi:MAG: 3-hydroxybutyrate dehydrogenase [Rhodospirillales bacterium]